MAFPASPHQSLLDGLPLELTWKIFRWAGKAVLQLRLTSRAMKTSVDDCSMQRMALPIIDDLRVFTASERLEVGFVPNAIAIIACLPSCYSWLFDLRLISNGVIKRRPKRHGFVNGIYCIQYYFVFEVNDHNMLERLNKSMGTQIGRVEIDRRYDCLHFSSIGQLLNEKQFEQLAVYINLLSSEGTEFLLRMVTDSGIQQFTLSVYDVNTEIQALPAMHNSAAVFLQSLSASVRSLHITQRYVGGVDDKRKYFFSLLDANWAKIILDMFSKKLDKLFIESYSDPEYLSSDGADSLIAQLPELGKQIWFSATCHTIDKNLAPYVHSEHSVKVINAGLPSCSLSVKHTSRDAELFNDYAPQFIEHVHSADNRSGDLPDSTSDDYDMGDATESDEDVEDSDDS